MSKVCVEGMGRSISVLLLLEDGELGISQCVCDLLLVF